MVKNGTEGEPAGADSDREHCLNFRQSRDVHPPMHETGQETAILLADITGSTPLYEAVGDAAAVRQVRSCLDRILGLVVARAGNVVSSKGDDVLATFPEPEAALAAAAEIVRPVPETDLAVHAGLHYGNAIRTDTDIYGDAVNLTARLAALANAGEVLISSALVERLPDHHRLDLRRLNPMRCKGKALPVEVYTLADDTPQQTEAVFLVDRPPTSGAVGKGFGLLLSVDGARHEFQSGREVTLGRAGENDIVVNRPWVSRQHATITIGRDRVQLTDRSSYGTYVTDALGCEFVALRETMVLAGAGRLSLGASASAADTVVIGYEVRRL